MIKRKDSKTNKTLKGVLIGLAIIPVLFVGSAMVVGFYEGFTGEEVVKVEEQKEERFKASNEKVLGEDGTKKAEAKPVEAKPVEAKPVEAPKTEAEKKAEELIGKLTSEQKAVFFIYRDEIVKSKLDDGAKNIAVMLMYEGVSKGITSRDELDYYVGSRLMDAMKKAGLI